MKKPKPNKLQENAESQFNELKIYEQKEQFTKQIETLKQQTSSGTEECIKVKNTIEIIGNRADHMEGRISKVKDRNLEIIQVEEKRKISYFKAKDLYISYLTFYEGEYYVMGSPEEGREKGAESLFKEMTDNF